MAPTLFRRCVQCPTTRPSCGICPSGEVCQLNPATCDSCASTSCIPSSNLDSASPTNTPSSTTSAGPVAGGVVAGVLVIAAVVFGVWWFCIRRRRRAYNEETWNEFNMGSEKSVDEQTLRRGPRASTHTVSSFASTALDRASNIIPIAYIPGVTQRSVHSSQDLVPPVPPIPAASPSTSPRLDAEGESHYFVPRDLRDSIADDQQRRSMARASIASTIYRNNAVVSPVSTQQISRAKPTAVSVRSIGKSPVISRSNTPPMPSMPSMPSQAGVQRPLEQSSIVGRVGVPKSVQIKKSSSLRRLYAQPHVYELDGSASESGSIGRKPSFDPTMSPMTDISESDDEQGAGRRLVAPSGHGELAGTAAAAEMEGEYYRSRGSLASPEAFADAARHPKSTASLSQIIEEAALQASRGEVHTGTTLHSGHSSPGLNGVSPFSDSHAARTP